MTHDLKELIQRELSDLTSRRLSKLTDKQLVDAEQKTRWKPELVEEIYQYYVYNGKNPTAEKFGISTSQFREMFRRYPKFKLMGITSPEEVTKRNDTLHMSAKDWMKKYNVKHTGLYYKTRQRAKKYAEELAQVK